jgi:hypothetical protein
MHKGRKMNIIKCAPPHSASCIEISARLIVKAAKGTNKPARVPPQPTKRIVWWVQPQPEEVRKKLFLF